MLSAIAAFTDRVEAMHAGCDDYLAKRYAFAEVLAHLQTLGRRADRNAFDETKRNLEELLPGKWPAITDTGAGKT